MRRALLSVLVAAMLLAPGAEAQQRPTGGPEMWDLSNPAEPRHWFSGLRCWREVSGAAFVHRTAFEPIGGDVSCGYAAASDYFITVYVTLRRPLGAPYDAVVQQTAQEVRGRYERTETLFEGPRNVATARGPVSMDELVLNVSGFDSADRRVIRALTGVWHVDVAGWTLKLRLTAQPDGRSLSWMRERADAIVRRAYEDLEAARTCAGVGMTPPERIELNEEKKMQISVMAAVLGIALPGAAPESPEAARRAGFVCLGSAFRGPNGELATSVMPAPGRPVPTQDASSPADPRFLASLLDARIVAIGEIREGAAARKIAVFDMPLDSLAVEGGRKPRGHLVFAFEGGNVSYYGPTFDRPADSGGMAAITILAGAPPAVSVTSRGEGSQSK